MSGGSEVIFDDQTRDSDSDLYSELPDSGAGYDNITSARDLQIKEREKLDNKVSALFQRLDLEAVSINLRCNWTRLRCYKLHECYDLYA